MTTLAPVHEDQTPANLVQLYPTSCRIEGRTHETIRSDRQSLHIFLQPVQSEDILQDPQSSTAAPIYQFLGYVTKAGVFPSTQWRTQRQRRRIH